MVFIGAGYFLSIIYQGIARTQSPTTINYTPEFPTFGGIAGFSQYRSAMERPRPGGASLVIKATPAPGKYDDSGGYLQPNPEC